MRDLNFSSTVSHPYSSNCSSIRDQDVSNNIVLVATFTIFILIIMSTAAYMLGLMTVSTVCLRANLHFGGGCNHHFLVSGFNSALMRMKGTSFVRAPRIRLFGTRATATGSIRHKQELNPGASTQTRAHVGADSVGVNVATNRSQQVPLSERFRHLLDDTITFDEESHVYMVSNNKAKYSVTGAISFFFNKFDANKSIESMMNKSDWPRPDYVVSSVAVRYFFLADVVCTMTENGWHYYDTRGNNHQMESILSANKK
jgi:hypothetical protein